MSEMAVSQKLCAHRMGIFGHAPTGEEDHFHFSQQIFILSKEELAGPAEEQIFCPAKLPMPRKRLVVNWGRFRGPRP
jgi:hypothetical protein